MKVKCDIVRCAYNNNCTCGAEMIKITPNHFSNLESKDYFEYIECSTYKRQVSWPQNKEDNKSCLIKSN